LRTVTEAPVAGGLTSRTAAERLGRYGPNDPAPRKSRSALIDFVRLFLNPLVLVLLIAAFGSTALGEAADVSIIVAIVILSNTLDSRSPPHT